MRGEADADVVLRLEIRGTVQGVGFRWAMSTQAQALGVRGWVRNRADGSVEAVVAGPKPAVDRIAAWARSGPPAAMVSGVRIDVAEGRFTAFVQRPDG